MVVGAVALWAAAVFATEIVRSLTQIDIPSESPGFEFLFGLLYHAIPIAASVLYLPFHLYWAGAAASTAGSVFLSRKGIPADLLSMTSGGMRRFVRSRFFFVCRAYFPYAVLNAAVIWALAVYSGYENGRVTYFYLSSIRPRIIVEIARIPFFPELSELMIPAAIALIASLGTLILISACGVTSAAIAPPRFRFITGAVSRVLIWGAAFGLVMVDRLRQSFDVVGPVIGMFLDSGRSHASSYLPMYYEGAQLRPPSSIILFEHSGYITALIYLILCIALSWLILALTVRLLRRA